MTTATLLMLASMLVTPFTTASASETTPAVATSAAGPEALTLVRSLKQQPPTRTAFAEARFSRLLDRPLMVSGELAWKGGDHLERKVTQPYVESTVIDENEVAVTREGHGTHHFSLDRAPPLKALLQSMVAVLAGDPARLDGMFEARVDGDGDSWTLTLTPSQASLARKLSHIRLDGGMHTLRCIEIGETGGTVSVDLLGPLAARMPEVPTREALTRLCRHAD